MDCLSQFDCDSATTCVAGRCVGTSVGGNAFDIYVQEIHPRLVSECGICHAAAEESQPTPLGDPQEDELLSFESDNPFGLPTYSTRLGDSGWRIYIDKLTPERLRASYEDTLQYLNFQAPEQSLLFAYGRGDVGVSQNLPHPKLYPTAEELNQTNVTSLTDTNYVGYQRLLNWVRLTHLSPVAITYTQDDLEYYRNTFRNVFGPSCIVCHSGDPTNTVNKPRDGGIAFFSDPMVPSDLSALTALINPESPAESALIRLIYGELDHIDLSIGNTEDYEATALEWIERLR